MDPLNRTVEQSTLYVESQLAELAKGLRLMTRHQSPRIRPHIRKALTDVAEALSQQAEWEALATDLGQLSPNYFALMEEINAHREKLQRYVDGR